MEIRRVQIKQEDGSWLEQDWKKITKGCILKMIPTKDDSDIDVNKEYVAMSDPDTDPDKHGAVQVESHKIEQD